MPIWITYVIVLHYPHKPMDLTNHIPLPTPFNYQPYYIQIQCDGPPQWCGGTTHCPITATQATNTACTTPHPRYTGIEP